MEDRAVLGSDVELPSRGLLYDGKIPGGKVVVGPMTFREEKILASSGPNSGASNIDMLLERCVFLDRTGTPTGVTPDEYLTGDRFFLIQAIRAVSFGQKYEFRMGCESCKKQFITSVNVPDDLEVVHLKEDYHEPFEVELPISKIKLGLRLLRGRDDKAIIQWAEQQYKRVDISAHGDPAYTYRIAKSVAWLEIPEILPHPMKGQRIENTGPKATEQIIQILEMLTALDSSAYRDAMSAHDCGVNTEIEFNCPHCRTIFVQPMPTEIEFFRPGGRKGVRYG